MHCGTILKISNILKAILRLDENMFSIFIQIINRITIFINRASAL